jgi:hypothetical protein
MGFSPPRFLSAGNGAYTDDLVLVWTDIEGKVKVLACLDAYANLIYGVSPGVTIIVTHPFITRSPRGSGPSPDKAAQIWTLDRSLYPSLV